MARGSTRLFFAPHLRPRQWLPSDPNPIARASIVAWRDQGAADNLWSPIALDACDPIWPVEAGLPAELEPIAAIVNINMIHIAPWAAGLGLLAAAGRILPAGGILYLYGPFRQNGTHTAPSNAAFDDSLRSQNPEWGVRNLETVVEVAQTQGLSLLKTIAMPANNLSVIFQAEGN